MKVESLAYSDNGVNFMGHIAYEPSDSPKPAVLVVPSWSGRDTFVCDTAESLASQGYVGIAVDVYGEARVGASKEENASLMNPLLEDRHQLVRRLRAAVNAVASRAEVDASRIAVMGYCFGGLCALDCARHNFPIVGVVSLHGNLSAPEDTGSEKIQAPILVLHGFEDPLVPMDHLTAFTQEMTVRKAHWECDIYGRALHAFTNPKANDYDFGTVYNQEASTRAWQRTLDFLSECFH